MLVHLTVPFGSCHLEEAFPSCRKVVILRFKPKDRKTFALTKLFLNAVILEEGKENCI